MSANEKQIDGDHYKTSIEHWDYVIANDLDYFQAQITKYVTRWKKKNGIVDLEKAQHFLEKYIEAERNKLDRLREEYRKPIGPALYDQSVVDKKVKAQWDKINISKGVGMDNPFGYDFKKEIGGGCEHPLAGVLQNVQRDE